MMDKSNIDCSIIPFTFQRNIGPVRGNPDNLINVYTKGQPWELEIGQLYYDRQRNRMQRRADAAQIGLPAIVAAFSALSPNNAESTNYRALDTCLDIVSGKLPENWPVIAYTPNKLKAIKILRGGDIDQILKGRKVYAFYRNTMDPNDESYVTVDGHMLGAWAGHRYVLRREAYIKTSEYPIISQDFRSAAQCFRLPAPHFQATVWLVWKRINRILWSPQQTFEWEELL